MNNPQYVKIKDNQNEDMGLAGFVGFGCSYGGKWWGGLAREHRGDDFCKTPKASLMRDFEGVKTATFLCGDYRDVEIPQNQGKTTSGMEEHAYSDVEIKQDQAKSTSELEELVYPDVEIGKKNEKPTSRLSESACRDVETLTMHAKQ